MQKIVAKHFRAGVIQVSPEASALLSEYDVHRGLSRHFACDWGELDEAGRRANNEALQRGRQLSSRHLSLRGTPFWIITNAERLLSMVQLTGVQ